LYSRIDSENGDYSRQCGQGFIIPAFNTECISVWNCLSGPLCLFTYSSEDEVMSRRQAEELLINELQYSRERVLEEPSIRRTQNSKRDLEELLTRRTQKSQRGTSVQSRTSSVHRKTVRQERRREAFRQGARTL